MSAVYPPSVSRLSAVCQPYVCRMSAIYPPYVCRGTAVCQNYVRRMSAICPPYVIRISVVCQSYPISQYAQNICVGLDKAALPNFNLQPFLDVPVASSVGEGEAISTHPGLRQTDDVKYKVK